MKLFEAVDVSTVFILAGGKSTRMGEDKALMAGGVTRLRNLALKAGVVRVVTLCGHAERAGLFEGEVWPDPPSCRSLMDVLQWIFGEVEGPIQLIPCDAFMLGDEGLKALLGSGGGVPIDPDGRRQPLLSHCPQGWMPGMEPSSVLHMFSTLPSLSMAGLEQQMQNFNRPESTFG
tara:strand:+ start:2851 stop:3375 length:525 start_codon:yes stop_codon:yes gene_type:complete